MGSIVLGGLTTLLVVLLLICISLAVFYIYLRRKKKTWRQVIPKYKGFARHDDSSRNGDADNILMTTKLIDTSPVHDTTIPSDALPPAKTKHQPINVADLADYIKRKNDAGEGFNLKAEYEELKYGQLGKWEVGVNAANISKNKFTDVVAYDHSRVVLATIDGDVNSDYINASYINGYRNVKYIATQGTMSKTEADFWRMVWQENTRTILMATNLIEQGRKKCTQYWPDLHKSLSRGVYIVKNIHEERFADSVIRTFHISEIDRPRDVREVKQFHFTVWPDMGVPNYTSDVLSFLRRVKTSNPTNAGLMVVHCSAGIGRTGTFITIDSMLEMAKEEDQVDIFNFVAKGREDRINFVQTSDQYAFIYNAVLEATLCGSTEIPCKDLRITLEQLKRRSANGIKTGLQLEFENLDKLCPTPHSDEYKSANEPNNAHKNRYPDILPLDSNRPYLMTPAKKGDYANYINASFLSSYAHKDAFIATQMPLPDTVGDFWRMVYDWKSLTIVMLNDMTEDMQDGQYWPDDGHIQYGPLRVEVLSEQQHGDVIERKISLQHVDKMGIDNSRFITQFQAINWPNNHDTPISLNAMTDVMAMVKKNQSDVVPVIVHCSNGIGRTGIFCTMVAVSDKIRREQIVDIFQAVKTLRLNRPGMVESLAQYTYCYDAILKYLDQFVTYENLMI
ncbi:receptor-type tyrosine-protein phosphatase mu-like [Saccoglossus kowalevskii]